jgi:hypothetical protein
LGESTDRLVHAPCRAFGEALLFAFAEQEARFISKLWESHIVRSTQWQWVKAPNRVKYPG